MLRHRVKQIVVISLIIGAAICSYGFTIARKGADNKTVDFTSIPEKFGEWRMVSQQGEMSGFEKNFLNNVLFRNYVRADGNSISLAVAYGADQRQNFSIHVPEGCYRAAGYDVTAVGITRLSRPDMPLKQLVACKGRVTETIQYWIVLNDKVVTNHFERKLKQLYYSLMGARAGGVLVRVSSVSSVEKTSRDYDLQKRFIADLYNALKPEQRRLLFGYEKI
jgi:EpsI family protein